MYLTTENLFLKNPTQFENLFDNITMFTDFVTYKDLSFLLLNLKRKNILIWESQNDDYSDTFNNLKQFINVHMKTNAYKYYKIVESTKLEYNPIWNVDGTETTDTTRTPNITHGKTGTDTTTTETKNNQTITADKETKNNQSITNNTTIKNNQSQTVTETPNTAKENNKGVTSYDSATFNDSEKTVEKLTGNTKTVTDYSGTADTENTTTSYSGNADKETTTTTYSGNADTVTTNYTAGVTETETGTDTTNTTVTRQGNIGVTSTQNLIKQEREIANLNIIYDYINDLSRFIFLNIYD